jgi:hypothetical protein
VAGLLAVASSQAASIVIDDFSTAPAPGQIVLAFGAPNASTVADGNVLGGFRTVSVNAGAGDAALAGVNLIGGQQGFLINEQGSVADATFLYDNNGAGLAWNASQYANNAFSLDYDVDDSAADMVIAFTVSDGVNSATWTSPVLGANAAGTMVTAPLNTWVGLVNLAGVSSVSILLDSETVGVSPGDDAVIDNFCIPEPSTYAGMFALGLAGFAAFRRFRS